MELDAAGASLAAARKWWVGEVTVRKEGVGRSSVAERRRELGGGK